MLNAASISSGTTPTYNGIFIPYTSLEGIEDGGEFGGSPEEIFSKISAAVINTMQRAIASLSSPLGVSVAKPNPTGAGTDIINQNIALTWQYVANLSSGEVAVLPANDPSIEVAFTDVFPASEIIGGGAYTPVAADSVGIPIADLTALNAAITVANKAGNLGNDQRDMLEALTRLVQNQTPLRSASQQSAVTTKTQTNANGLAVPNGFLNNTTFVEADLQNLALFSRTYSITHQYQLNHDTQKFEVRVA